MTTEEFPELPECAESEDFVNGECVDACIARAPCGENAICKQIDGRLFCQCNRGYSGNPLESCFKHDEKCPCDPNPCGPNSECVEKDEAIGPHCKCNPKFYDFPPNCREGCESHDDCASDEFCKTRENRCVKICDSSQCGENAKCRPDKERLKSFCSCLDGFIPEKNVGCREKTADDFEPPIDFIKEIVTDPCGEKCGRNAYCGSDNECVCTQGYEGDPHKQCKLITTSTTLDICNPNPCGPYSMCNVIEDNLNCSCVDGFGTAPFCSACYSSASCGQEMLCVGGKCVENICDPFCGENAGCNVFNDTLECFCNFPTPNNNPFNFCSTATHIPPNVIATLLG